MTKIAYRCIHMCTYIEFINSNDFIVYNSSNSLIYYNNLFSESQQKKKKKSQWGGYNS